MEIRTNNICIHLNYFKLESCSFYSSFTMPQEEWTRNHQKGFIQGSKWGPKCSAGPLKEVLKSSARSIEKAAWTSLTLFDWMTVYAYVDTIPRPTNQGRWYNTLPQGLKVHYLSPSPLCRENCPHLSRRCLICVRVSRITVWSYEQRVCWSL